MHTIFWLENLKGRDYLEDLRVNGKITLYLRETGWVNVDWIHLAQDRDQVAGLL
jgi:hypothetical protein